MAIAHRIESLQKRHAGIEADLLAEESRPALNQDLIHALKKEKLFIKDEIVRLQQEMEVQAA